MGRQKRKAEALSADEFQRKTVHTATSPPSIKSLPEDLLVEILAKVAASSFFDLYNAKLANKEFLEAAADCQIFHDVSLRNFPTFSWKKSSEFSCFMENCEINGNPEALYRKGMIELFSYSKEASGLRYLKASAEKGHVEASYVYGVVLCRTTKLEEGAEFLKRCEEKGGVGRSMRECRWRIKAFVREIWIRNKIFLEEEEYLNGRRSCSCVGKNINLQRRIMGWDWTDEDDAYGDDTCEACKWNGEIKRFCSMLRTGRYN